MLLLNLCLHMTVFHSASVGAVKHGVLCPKHESAQSSSLDVKLDMEDLQIKARKERLNLNTKLAEAKAKIKIISDSRVLYSMTSIFAT